MRRQFFFDVTSEVRAQHALEAAQAELKSALARETQARCEAEAANQYKDNFLAMLGHEMRNPLAPIVTALHLMRRKGADNPEVDVMERQVRHLVRLVDDLMDVARIAKGKIALRMSYVEIGQVVSRAAEMTGPELDHRQQKLMIDVPSDGLMVCADPDRLSQIISNLIVNASRYSPVGSDIAIAGELAKGNVVLRVRDHGMGIAPEMLEKIFDTFVQEEHASNRPSGGLGLGLSIVRSLVAMHGGTVSVMSEGPGKGSEFTFELPATGPPSSQSSGTFPIVGR